jgi:hypothetical protein
LKSKDDRRIAASQGSLPQDSQRRESLREFGVPVAPARPRSTQEEAKMRLIILIILVVGALPSWPCNTRWGYDPVKGLGTLLIIVMSLALLGYVELAPRARRLT